MFSFLCNKSGIGLVEVIVAILVTSIGVVALLGAQPNSWKLSTRSDYLGRAAGILQSELNKNEALIMNANLPVTAGQTTKTVFASGLAVSQPGDATFTVTTNIALTGTNVWRVRVTVTWTANQTGISESILVTPQQPFSS